MRDTTLEMLRQNSGKHMRNKEDKTPRKYRN